jgi:hypothetical protein
LAWPGVARRAGRGLAGAAGSLLSSGGGDAGPAGDAGRRFFSGRASLTTFDQSRRSSSLIRLPLFSSLMPYSRVLDHENVQPPGAVGAQLDGLLDVGRT